MTTIELSHREWLQQGKILATQQRYLESDAAVHSHSSALPPESSIDLRHYDTRRLGYSVTRHPVAQLQRSRTSGGVSPLQPRDVLRSSGSMFFCTESDASGLPHAEAKLAAFKRKYQQLTLQRAFPEQYEVKATPVQQRVKTALKDIVHVEESKRSGQRDETGEVLQSTLVISCGPQRVMLEVKQTVHVDAAEAARKRAADAAAAAAAAAELRASVGQSSVEAAAAPTGAEAYDHTGGDVECKPHVGSGRPGPGGGGGGTSRVVGAAESAQRDKFNHEKRNEVRLNTAHSGADTSESGSKVRSPATGTHPLHKGRPGGEALSPVQQAYGARPWTRIQVLPSRHSVSNQQSWDITYALRPQEFFDARLKRKTDAVTGRVSKFAAENNRLWSTDLAKQMTDSMVPVGLPDRRFAAADRPWASSSCSPLALAASPSATRHRTFGSASSPPPEWRLPAPAPNARTSPLKRMIDVGVFEPTSAPPCPKHMAAKFTSSPPLSKLHQRQWRQLTHSSSYGGLLGTAEDASKLGHIRRRVPELGGA